MVPKRGAMVFVATVVQRVLPAQLTLSLNAPRVSVSITDTFRKLSDRTTRLISEEVFTFRGLRPAEHRDLPNTATCRTPRQKRKPQLPRRLAARVVWQLA